MAISRFITGGFCRQECVSRHGKLPNRLGGAEQIARLKQTLRTWPRDLVAGQYDKEYVSRRWRVGLRHVEIGLSQVFTNAALSRLRRGLLHALELAWTLGPRLARRKWLLRTYRPADRRRLDRLAAFYPHRNLGCQAGGCPVQKLKLGKVHALTMDFHRPSHWSFASARTKRAFS